MKKIVLLAIVCCLVLTLGCTGTFDKKVSMNVQRAGLNGSAKIGVSVALDMQSADTVMEKAAKIKETCKTLLTFLDTGSIAALTESELAAELVAKVPVEHRYFIQQVVAAAMLGYGPTASVSKIGKDNIERMKAFLYGTIQGVDEYKLEDRTDGKRVLVEEPEAEHDEIVDDFEEFGKQLAR